MKTETKQIAFIPRPWQLPHLLATPIGGTVLLVERCEDYLDEDGFWRHDDGRMFALDNRELIPPLGPVGTVLACKERLCSSRVTWERDAPKQKQRALYSFDLADVIVNGMQWPWSYRGYDVAAYHAPMKSSRLFFRTTAIDLRKTDTMTEREAGMAGCCGWYTAPHPDFGETDGCLPSEQFEEQWLADNPGAKWGDWAWFITAERVERA